MAEEGIVAGDGMDVNAALREVLRPPSPTKAESAKLPRPQPSAKPVSVRLRPTGGAHARQAGGGPWSRTPNQPD
eukprot:bmy_03675T0